MQAIVLAGGEGKRLKSIINTIPKPLAPINNKPLLDYIIEHAKKNGCDNIIVCTGYLSEKIEEHVNNTNYGVTVRVSKDDKPLGTAGALHLIDNLLEDEFFVLYGDVFTTINLEKMFQFHKQKKSHGTLALHTSSHPQDSTVVKIDKNSRILNLVEKPGDKWEKYDNLTSTSLYVLKKGILSFIEKDKEVDIAKDIFPKMLNAGKNLFGYVTNEYAKDMGTPERYKEVDQYVKITDK